MNWSRKSLELHKKLNGKLEVKSLVKVEDKDDLSIVYTPGVAEVSRAIAKNKELVKDLTWKGRTVAIVSDGSAVLGLGNIGPEAGLPVMEGKALILSEFAGLSSIPLVVDLHTSDELVAFVKAIKPSFGAINLEDIAAPVCFEVEDRLQDLGIPVFHDDQHGTAIVVRAGVGNAAKVVGKKFEDLKVVVSGAGAAGLAITQLLLGLERDENGYHKVRVGRRVKEVIVLDSRGIISSKRKGLNKYKLAIAEQTNPRGLEGSLEEALKGADVFIGVSKGGVLRPEMIELMADKPIVLAMANPDPEIMPDEALKAGAYVVGTGRSDFPNQVNNSLAFPGLFKGMLMVGAKRVTLEAKLAAVEAIETMIKPSKNQILPNMFEHGLVDRVAMSVAKVYKS